MSQSKSSRPKFLWGDAVAMGAGLAALAIAAVSAADLPRTQRGAAEGSFWTAALIAGILVSANFMYNLRGLAQLKDRPQNRRALSQAFWVIVPLSAAGGLLLNQNAGHLRFFLLGGLAGLLVWAEIAHLLLVWLSNRSART